MQNESRILFHKHRDCRHVGANRSANQPWGEIGEPVRDLRSINPAMLLPSTAPIHIGAWAYRANSSREPDPRAKNQACHHWRKLNTSAAATTNSVRARIQTMIWAASSARG